jgi:glucosamine--fructose-6-phosphate aminotransferase (isomerizing)
MLNITLPDGSQRQFPAPLTVGEVAASIGAGLAKAALAGKVDGQLVDLSHRIEADARLAIVTDRDADGLEMIDELEAIPDKITSILKQADKIKAIAEKHANAEGMLFMGRQLNYPVAMEGALKMKEISYIHSEGYPAAEMKHGPIALVDRDTPSVFLISRGLMFNKVMSNLEEVKARGGPVIAVASERISELSRKADEVIVVPKVAEYLQPVVSNIPMQLFAYHMALLRGCDVDKPRNLAKSVTVE